MKLSNNRLRGGGKGSLPEMVGEKWELRFCGSSKKKKEEVSNRPETQKKN